MTEYSAEEVAGLVGADLAAQLSLDDGPYSESDLEALTDAFESATSLADAVADGDVAALATLLQPGFLEANSEFSDFAAFLAASPWTREDVGDAFSGRSADEPEPPAATTSAFLTRTTAFRTPGELVQAAVVHRCRRAIDSTPNDD